MEFKTLAMIAARVLVALVAIVLLLRLAENKFIFFPEKISINRALPPTPGFAVENIWLQSVDGVRLSGWLIASQSPASPSPATVLYLHGNAGSLFDRVERLVSLAAQGFTIFAIDYRGYGWSGGTPTEAGLYRDAAAAYKYLIQHKHVDPGSLFFYGESLGTAVAIELALDHPCGGLILESPFTSFEEVGKAHYFFIPGFVYHFMSNDWNSLDRIRRLKMPKFIVHGDRDQVIPFAQGQRLFEAALPPKTFYPIHGAAHMECLELGGRELTDRLKAFVIESQALRSTPSPEAAHDL
ncbi:MAG: alpha/beta hydrolase [Acidobacteriia bacterium]|nr:alpha/beta hydrolase [Terriglobia bacterium]